MIERPRNYCINQDIKLSLAQAGPPDITAHVPPDWIPPDGCI